MTELERYLTEEVAIDHADGLITRREALRRLSLMGLTAASAGALLAACNETKSPAGPPPTGPVCDGTPSGGDAAAPTCAITFPGPEGRTLQAQWAPAEKPRGAVLVIHENRGLMDHFRVVASRFAAVGYSALALDLLSEEGGTASLGDSANATAALNKVAKENPGRFDADMKAALDELTKRAPGVKLGAIGFCFGGAMMWRLVAVKDPRLAAAAPFYGVFPEGTDYATAPTAVLGVYGALDTRVNATQPAAKAALEKAALAHELVTYEGADHAFFNDTGARYNADAAAKAWTKVLEWFGKYVG